MASKEQQTILMRDGDIVPVRVEMTKIEEALGTLDQYETDLVKVEAEAKALVVVDAASFRRAGELTAMCKTSDKSVEATMFPFDEILKRTKAFITKQKQKVTNKAEQIRGTILTPKMAEYQASEKRKAEAEEARQRKEYEDRMKREAEEKRQKDEQAATARRKDRVDEIRADLKAGKINKRESEKLLRQAGATEEADKAAAAAAKDEADAEAQQQAKKLTVAPDVPNVPGVVKRTNWVFKVVNPYKVNLRYLVPDEVAIGVEVRRIKNKAQAETEIGGIEVEEKHTF